MTNSWDQVKPSVKKVFHLALNFYKNAFGYLSYQGPTLEFLNAVLSLPWPHLKTAFQCGNKEYMDMLAVVNKRAYKALSKLKDNSLNKDNIGSSSMMMAFLCMFNLQTIENGFLLEITKLITKTNDQRELDFGRKAWESADSEIPVQRARGWKNNQFRKSSSKHNRNFFKVSKKAVLLMKKLKKRMQRAAVNRRVYNVNCNYNYESKCQDTNQSAPQGCPWKTVTPKSCSNEFSKEIPAPSIDKVRQIESVKQRMHLNADRQKMGSGGCKKNNQSSKKRKWTPIEFSMQFKNSQEQPDDDGDDECNKCETAGCPWKTVTPKSCSNEFSNKIPAPSIDKVRQMESVKRRMQLNADRQKMGSGGCKKNNQSPQMRKWAPIELSMQFKNSQEQPDDEKDDECNKCEATKQYEETFPSLSREKSVQEEMHQSAVKRTICDANSRGGKPKKKKWSPIDVDVQFKNSQGQPDDDGNDECKICEATKQYEENFPSLSREEMHQSGVKRKICDANSRGGKPKKNKWSPIDVDVQFKNSQGQPDDDECKKCEATKQYEENFPPLSREEMHQSGVKRKICDANSRGGNPKKKKWSPVDVDTHI